MDEYDPNDLEKAEAYRLVVKARRRILLNILAESESEHTVENLSTKIATHEKEDDAEQIDDATIEQISLSLSHTHLPQLAERNIIDFEPEKGTVTPKEPISDLEPLI